MSTNNASASARNALLLMSGAAPEAPEGLGGGGDFSKVDKARESDIRRQALSTDAAVLELMHGHKGSRGREEAGAPVVTFKASDGDDDSGFVVGDFAIGGPRGGGGGRGGGRGGGGGGRGRGGRGGGGGRGRHHHPGHHRGWRGGAPWPWGAVLDTGPAYYLDVDDFESECEEDGPTLYMPNGEGVCPGDRRYPALARAFALAHSASGWIPGSPSALGTGGYAVGDLGCSGVNVDEWKRQNRVKLYPGERHRWLLAISTAKSTSGLLGSDLSTMSEDELRTNIEGGVANGSIFGKWFEKIAGIPLSGEFTGTSGKIDNLRMLAFGSKETMLAVAEKSGLVAEARADDTKNPTVDVPAPKVYALVEFIYRSVQDSMPWPVYNDLVLANKWCPLGAQVALSVAFRQSKDSKDVPKETSLLNPSTFIPGVPSTDDIAAAAKSLGAGIGSAAKGIGEGVLYLGLGIAALAAVVMIKK